MNFSIRSKLRLISLVPVLFMIGFSSYFLYQALDQYFNVQKLQNRIAYNKLVENLMSDLDKERGMSAVYLASRGRMVKESLTKQRLQVNKSLSELNKFAISHTGFTMDKLPILLLKMLPTKRIQIDSLEANFNKIFFNYFTVLNGALLDEMGKISDYQTAEIGSGDTKSYLSMSKAKEYSGIERGFIAYILTRYTKMSENEMGLWLEYIGQADNYDFSIIENEELKQKIKNILQNEDSMVVFDDITEARIAIMHSVNDGYYTIDPTLWFNLLSEKNVLIDEGQKAILNNLTERTEESKQFELFIAGGSVAIWVISLILALFGYWMGRDITRNIDSLERVLRNVAQSTSKEDVTINLDTSEGTSEAYSLLEKIVEDSRVEREIAQEASEAKSLFLANMSHEIRTPLNGIVGFTELLKNTELKGEQKEFVSIIEKSSENLLEIINNILDLSKIESQKVEIENIVFNPIEEFESAVEIYGVKAAEKNVNLGMFMDPSLFQPVKGDPTKIKEILINLMSNAVKFTNSGGSINVEIRRVQAHNEGYSGIQFTVEDTGIGISEDKKAHIFDAFSQADTSITRKFGGTGLGLTISSRYCDLMGGHLQLESELGKGTRFFFMLELEELPGMNESLQGHYLNETVAIYRSAQHEKKESSYIKSYLEYYGAKVITFESKEDLNALQNNQGAQVVLIDADYANDQQLPALTHTELPCVLLIKSTQQKRVDSLRLQCDKILYEPITTTKSLEILKIGSRSKRAPKEKITPAAGKALLFRAKALVAEDNLINQKLIQRTLSNLGLDVTTANNGLEAFEKRKNGNFDIVFMDISMPVMDGVESTHEILDYEEDEGVAHIPIVALTANALKGDRERFMAEGLDEYTTKPLIREEIIAILKKFLADKTVTQAEQPTQSPEEAVDTESFEEEAKQHQATDHTEENEPVAFEFEEAAREKEPKTRERKDKTILVMKKSGLENRIFNSILEGIGYDTNIANTYDQLVSAVKKSRYGLIMVDKESPKLDMQELCRLANSPEEPTDVVMFVDPLSREETENRFACAEVIENMINRDLLRLIIEKHL